MISELKRCMDQELDIIINCLIKKESTAFIKESVDLALNAICDNGCESIIVKILLNQGSIKSPLMKVKIIKCLERIAQRLQNRFVSFKEADKIVCSLANFVSDSSLDVRNASKKALLTISNEIINSMDFDKLLNRSLNEENYIKVKAIVSKISCNKTNDHLIITNSNHESLQSKNE